MKKLLVALLVVLMFIQGHFVAADGTSSNLGHSLDDQEGGNSGALFKKYYPPKINCQGECRRRCSKASRQKICHRACNSCCVRCNCVPPGTYGNKEVCPCYASLRTHGNRLKCP